MRKRDFNETTREYVEACLVEMERLQALFKHERFEHWCTFCALSRSGGSESLDEAALRRVWKKWKAKSARLLVEWKPKKGKDGG